MQVTIDPFENGVVIGDGPKIEFPRYGCAAVTELIRQPPAQVDHAVSWERPGAAERLEKAQLIERILFQMIESAKAGNKMFDKARRKREERQARLEREGGEPEMLTREEAAAAIRAATGGASALQ